jgi:nucleoid-associated protein YgaU
VVKRAHWVLLAPTVALGALCDPSLAQDAKPDDPVRRQAEELAEEASKRFGEVLKGQSPAAKPEAQTSPVGTAQDERSLPLLLYWFDYSEHEYRGILRRLALEGAQKGWDPATVGWLKRSSQEFQAIMQRLARAGAPASKWDPVAEAHQRAGRDKERAPDGNAGPAAPAARAPAGAIEPGPAVAERAAGGGEAKTKTESGPEAEAIRPPGEDGRAIVEAPPKRAAGPQAIAAAEPAKPQPAHEAAPGVAPEAASDKASGSEPQPEQAAERAAVPDDPPMAPKAVAAPEREVSEPPAAVTGGPAPRQHEEDAGTTVVTAEAKAAKDRPLEDRPAEDKPSAAAAPASGLAEGSPGAVTPDKPPTSNALKERQASKIATPLELEGRPARHAKGTKAERCKAAGAKVALPGWYVVKTGDTLWAIAERHYGAGARYRTIFLANRERLKRGPDLIMPCQQLYLPRQRRGGS